jgi:hypothetical protein
MSKNHQKKHSASDDGSGKTLKSWLIVIGIALLFLCWGLLVFLTVGDKGPPRWDFGVVEDIPGESPYSSERDWRVDPSPQHVID